MKHYAILPNNKFKSYGTDIALIQDDDTLAKFYLIDISTNTKGPIYTVVKDINRSLQNQDIRIAMDISYRCEDCPFSADTTIFANIIGNTFGKLYSVNSSIIEMMRFNDLQNVFLYMDKDINYDAISINIDGKHVRFDENSSDSEIKKFFKKNNMLTSCIDILNRKVIVLYEDSYSIMHCNDFLKSSLKFKYVFFYIVGMETLYRLSYKQYRRILNIESIKVVYDINESSTGTLNDIFDTDDDQDECLNELEFRGLSSILTSFIHLPQFLLLEQALYGFTNDITININTKEMNYELYISGKEIDTSISLFKIVNKVLSIK